MIIRGNFGVDHLKNWADEFRKLPTKFQNFPAKFVEDPNLKFGLE